MKPKSKDIVLRNSLIAVFLVLAVFFIARFAGGPILKLYVLSGIGNCQKIPILCMAPTQKISDPEIDKEYAASLLYYKFPRISVSVPRGFSVVQELIKRPFYKKNKRLDKGAVIYLLRQDPGYFITLYPQVSRQGVTDNYLFIKRMLSSKESDIKNIYDAFFIIMKGIFTPDLGDQKSVVMAEISIPGKRGFVNYSLGQKDNYFDCNIIDKGDNFYKVYIKDKGAKLDLSNVFAIISTLEEVK
jgi:hypothetical protein